MFKTMTINYGGPPFQHFLEPFEKIRKAQMHGAGELTWKPYNPANTTTTYEIDVTKVEQVDLEEAVAKIKRIDRSVKAVFVSETAGQVTGSGPQ